VSLLQSESVVSEQQGFPSLVAEGLNIVEAMEKKGATLRLMDGVAIKIHTTKFPRYPFKT